MRVLYLFFIQVLGFSIRVASYFHPKAKLWVEGRNNWEEKMKQSIAVEDRVLWVHCSSLGEFEQGRPLMERLKKEYPQHKLAVSFFSPSGYEVRKDYKGADYIFYLPLDTVQNAKKLIKNLHPELLILVKYEYWYNLLYELSKAQIPVVVISAVIREKAFFFRVYSSWFRYVLSLTRHFFVQNKDSKNLLNSIQIKQVSISGDTRFDRVKEIYQSSPQLDFMEKFKAQSKLIVVGSSWPDDDKIWIDYLNENFPKDWKIVLAPHIIEENKIQSLLQNILPKSIRYTQIQEENLQDYQVLILDTIGILTSVYAYADVSYVGGGFTKTGIHNALEPAVFGVPLIFGPNYQNYFEAMDLINSGAAVRFKDAHDFKPKMTRLIQEEDLRRKRGEIAFDYVQNKPNSSDLIMKFIKKELIK